ncbi:MAG TPA: hypothetical protein VIU12_16390 [Chryseolinea sp.]
MKKLIVLGAGLLLASVVTYAQVDTTSTQQRSTPQQSTPQVAPQQQESQNATDQSKPQVDTKEMIRLQASEVPASLKRTLQAPEYEGWEDGTLYKDKSNNHYILQIQNGGKMRTYHFGSDGKPVGDN